MKNIIFMGEKPLAKQCLEYLLEKTDASIVGVCTRKEAENLWWGEQVARKYCKEKSIPLINREEILNFDKVDVIISVLYPFVVGKKVLDNARIAAVNLHQAPLPHYRGCNSVSHAIINGEKEYGATFHLMSEKLDSGPIIERKMFPIDGKITAYELYQKTTKVCFEIFKKNINNVLNGNFKTFYQEKDIVSHCYPRNSLKDKQADLSWKPERLYNFVRGLEFPPFEKAYLEVNGKKIYLSTRN